MNIEELKSLYSILHPADWEYKIYEDDENDEPKSQLFMAWNSKQTGERHHESFGEDIPLSYAQFICAIHTAFPEIIAKLERLERFEQKHLSRFYPNKKSA